LEGLLHNYGQSAAEPQVLSKSAPPLGKSYFLNVEYNNGIVKLNSVYLAPGNFKIPDRDFDKGKYKGQLISLDGKVIENFSFEIPKVEFPAMDENGTTVSPIIKSRFNYTLTIPYSTNGKTFEAYDKDNKKILSVDVGYLANTCGNGICEPQENYIECPSDCSLEGYDKLCIPNNDGVCDPDCKGRDPDCRDILTILKGNLALVILIAALIISLVLLMTAKPSKDNA
jgi:hypothetical protein